MAAVAGLFTFVPVNAQHTSPNYEVNEYFFGAGGDIDVSSTNYAARASIGDLGVGKVTSTNYRAFGGFSTTDIEVLEMEVTAATIDFGTLDTYSTATGNGTFNVRNYISEGYTVETMSDSLMYGTEEIDPMTTAAASSASTEQFGMNLVANTSPTTFGAVPSQVPDSTFSFGAAATGYDSPNTYKYQKYDIVAESAKSTGQTDYTISYIVNVSANTPAGTYNQNHNLVVVATF